MKEKIFETILNKPTNPEKLKKSAVKKIKAGYFDKWGDYEYCWGKNDTLFFSNKYAYSKITFLKTKLKVDLEVPIIGKLLGEIVVSKDNKLIYYGDIPFLTKLMVMPVLKQVAEEIKKLA